MCLFINLGKRDGFYPGELMQTLNRYVGGRQEVGHIDLLDTISYFEVPEKDARKVMTQLSGIRYHGRTVRCNSEDDKTAIQEAQTFRKGRENGKKPSKKHDSIEEDGWKPEKTKRGKRNDWRELIKGHRK